MSGPLATSPLPTHGRFDFSPIVDRPDYSWPGGKRLAVWIAINIESFGFGLEGPTLGNPLPMPDQRNWSWREYGNRVGLWRMLEVADHFELPLAHQANSYLYDTHPQIMAALGKRPLDEILGHGRTNSEKPGMRPEAEERALIAEATAAIKKHEGKAPGGWMTPLQAESSVTTDLLKEAGYRYCVSWPCDDQPHWLTTRSGPLLNIPYAVETNDFVSVIHLRQDAPVYCDIVFRQFEEMVEQSGHRPLVLAISLHTFIMGQPHRLRCLRDLFRRLREHPLFHRVWLTTPGAIAAHCETLKPGIVPGKLMDAATQEIALGTVTLHAVATGQGPLALLLHGITANAYVFQPLMERLAGNFRLVSIDMRGHGRSSKPATGYAAKDYADDIEAVIRKLDNGAALLIGHALGARDAYVAAARDNGLVSGVVGIDFTPFIEPSVFEALGQRIAGGNRLFADTAAIETALSERYPLTPIEAIRRRVQYGYEKADGGWRPLARLDAMVQTADGMRESFEAAFASLKVPTLLVRGGESKFISPEVWARTRALRSDMRYVELLGADHYAAEQIPGPIAEEILSFRRRELLPVRRL